MSYCLKQLSAWPIKGNFSSKITFNLAYYTVAHKCNMLQLFAIPASYENKHRPSETGRSVCGCSNASSFIGSHVLLSARLLMLTFSSKGKAYLKRLGGKARVKKISSLPGESPSHAPSTLCLGSDLLFTPHASLLSSVFPLSASLLGFVCTRKMQSI